MRFNKFFKIILLLLLGVQIYPVKICAAQALLPPKELTFSELREGMWVWSSSHHSPIQRSNKVVQLIKSNDHWKIFFFTVYHTRDSYLEDKSPHIDIEGPFTCYVDNGIMHIQTPYGIRKYSFHFKDDVLYLPSVIRTNAETFNYTFTELLQFKSGKEVIRTYDYTLKCESDPTKVNKGSANIIILTPFEKHDINGSYLVKGQYGHPALAFHSKQKNLSDFFNLDKNQLSMKKIYVPADARIEQFIHELIKTNPNKANSADTKTRAAD